MLAGRGSDRTRAQPGQDKLLQTTKKLLIQSIFLSKYHKQGQLICLSIQISYQKAEKTWFWTDHKCLLARLQRAVMSATFDISDSKAKIKWIRDPARLLAAWHEESGQNFYRTQNQKWSDNWEAMTPFKEQHILISFTEKTCFDNSDNLWEWNGQHWAWALPGQRTGQSEAWADQSAAREK